MITKKLLFRSLLVLTLSVISVTVYSQEKTKGNNYKPQEGQEGKNVPWIPTPQDLVDKMLKMAKVTPSDFLMDLGSGDGRTVITAARLGTRAIGIEYNPELVKLSMQNAEKEGVSAKTQFIEADLFEYDFSKATVITMFLLPEINMRLRPKLLNLEPGTRIVSNTFTMQEWKYDDVARTGDDKSRWNSAYLWIIPAKIDGKWKLSGGGELTFSQEFQMFTGTLVSGAGNQAVTNGRLKGVEIVFTVGSDTYAGKVAGAGMKGSVTSRGVKRDWSAAR